jgi:K+ transporter
MLTTILRNIVVLAFALASGLTVGALLTPASVWSAIQGRRVLRKRIANFVVDAADRKARRFVRGW